ncbi:hypothetical protein OUZ56_014830 [Daphnia magna]|uniref:Uncharacterized protein n=1 Tax=Daphnia magna TaxID=35525 RepID=A0ABR0ALC4_9CRUS|nr:hypothetical protein OUZ56_014830 [Daphnia magna]
MASDAYTFTRLTQDFRRLDTHKNLLVFVGSCISSNSRGHSCITKPFSWPGGGEGGKPCVTSMVIESVIS